MLSTSIGSCLCARLRNIWRKRRRGGLWCSFVFILIFCLLPTLDIPAPRHHGSGGRIFQCSTRESGLHLFRGRKQKWRADGALLEFCCPQRAISIAGSNCYEAGYHDIGAPKPFGGFPRRAMPPSRG